MTARLTTAYADTAKDEIAGFVERSTRFITEDLYFTDEQYLDVVFRVDVLHQLSCSLSESMATGKSQHSSDDLVVTSSDEYKMVAESLRTEASGQLDVVRNLAKKISNGRYGLYVDDANFGSYHRSAYFTYTCHTCSGSGNVTCDSCNGSGTHTCNHCGGMGSTLETQWETDHRGNSTSTTCSETCMWCMGSGHTTCPGCGGSGKVTCGTCNGHGEMTDTATPIYVATSRYMLSNVSPSDRDVEYALNVRASLPSIGESLAKMGGRTIEAKEELRQVSEQVVFTCPFFKAHVAVGSASARMVVFGEKCLVSDAGRLIETLVQPDLAQLQEAIARVRWFDVPTMLYAQKIGHLFMESEVHQLAIEQAPAYGKDPDDYSGLADTLAKSLSKPYLCHAVGCMERLAALINNETKRVMGLTATPIIIATLAHFILQDSYFVAILSAAGIGLTTSLIGQFLIKLQIRRTGAERFEKFSVRRKTHNPNLLGWH